MNLCRLNLLTALASLAGACLWLAIGQNPTGLIWLVCSLVWLILGVAHAKSSKREPDSMRRLARRVSRLLLWG